MADVIRDLSAILALLADNTTGNISPQDVRDMVVSQVLPVYGEMRVEANSTPQTSISTTPAKLTSFNTDGLSNGCTVDSTTDNDIEVLTAGVVYAEFLCSFSGTASQTFFFEIYKNGAATGIRFERTMSGTPVTGAAACAGRITCAANDLFTVYVYSAAGSGHSVTVREAQLNVTRVK